MNIDSKQKKKNKPYDKYMERTCRSLHYCELCENDIKYSQKYYDGGYGRRVHKSCFDNKK
jgi:hypothetical protein